MGAFHSVEESNVDCANWHPLNYRAERQESVAGCRPRFSSVQRRCRSSTSSVSASPFCDKTFSAVADCHGLESVQHDGAVAIPRRLCFSISSTWHRDTMTRLTMTQYSWRRCERAEKSWRCAVGGGGELTATLCGIGDTNFSCYFASVKVSIHCAACIPLH